MAKYTLYLEIGEQGTDARTWRRSFPWTPPVETVEEFLLQILPAQGDGLPGALTVTSPVIPSASRSGLHRLPAGSPLGPAASGGGFILSGNHGEIPWQVPEEVLLTISAAVHKWGAHPPEWVKAYGP